MADATDPVPTAPVSQPSWLFRGLIGLVVILTLVVAVDLIKRQSSNPREGLNKEVPVKVAEDKTKEDLVAKVKAAEDKATADKSANHPTVSVNEDHGAVSLRRQIEKERKNLEIERVQDNLKEELAALQKEREEIKTFSNSKKEEKKEKSAASPDSLAKKPLSVDEIARAETERVREEGKRARDAELVRIQFQREISAEKAKAELAEENEKELKRTLNFNEALFNTQKAIADMGWWSDYLNSARNADEKAKRWGQYEKWCAEIDKRFKTNQAKLVPVIKAQQELKKAMNELSKN